MPPFKTAGVTDGGPPKLSVGVIRKVVTSSSTLNSHSLHGVPRRTAAGPSTTVFPSHRSWSYTASRYGVPLVTIDIITHSSLREMATIAFFFPQRLARPSKIGRQCRSRRTSCQDA